MKKKIDWVNLNNKKQYKININIKNKKKKRILK
jgi:hypothetical protein